MGKGGAGKRSVIKKSAPTVEVTNEGMLGFNSLGLAFNRSRNIAEDTTCFQTRGLNDKFKLVQRPKGPRLRDAVLASS